MVPVKDFKNIKVQVIDNADNSSVEVLLTDQQPHLRTNVQPLLA